MDESPPPPGWLHRFKRRLGILRIPIGILFLIFALFLIVTPFTPGSGVALFIGLELLNLREYIFDKFKK